MTQSPAVLHSYPYILLVAKKRREGWGERGALESSDQPKGRQRWQQLSTSTQQQCLRPGQQKKIFWQFFYCRDFLFVLVSFIFHKQGQHDQNAAGLQREGLCRSWSKAFVKTGISDCFDCFFLFNIGTTDCGCFSYFSLSKSLSLNEWAVLQLVCRICGRCPLVPEQWASPSFKFLSDYIFKRCYISDTCQCYKKVTLLYTLAKRMLYLPV